MIDISYLVVPHGFKTTTIMKNACVQNVGKFVRKEELLQYSATLQWLTLHTLPNCWISCIFRVIPVVVGNALSPPCCEIKVSLSAFNASNTLAVCILHLAGA